MITEEPAAEFGLEVVDAGLVLRAPTALTSAQRDALGDIQDASWQNQVIDPFVEPDDGPIAFPWLTALGLLVGIPVVAGVATLLTSAVAQRLRPIHMSTPAED